MTNRRVIGFDREIRAEWLDAVAAKVADGCSPRDVRLWLDTFLKDQVGGDGGGGNRGKTITVLSRIWSNVPAPCRDIRDRALDLVQQVGSDERLAIHWAMATAVYPFFGEVTSAVGRLLALQGDVRRQAILKRLADSWGDRPAVGRAGRAIWSSLASWGVMSETDCRGQYAPLQKKRSITMTTTGLLVEASVLTGGSKPIPLTAMTSWPGLFPFELADVAASVRASHQITIARQGGDLEMLEIAPYRLGVGAIEPNKRSIRGILR